MIIIYCHINNERVRNSYASSKAFLPENSPFFEGRLLAAGIKLPVTKHKQEIVPESSKS